MIYIFMNYTPPRFIQATLCETQGLFKDFLKTFILFSRTSSYENTDLHI